MLLQDFALFTTISVHSMPIPNLWWCQWHEWHFTNCWLLSNFLSGFNMYMQLSGICDHRTRSIFMWCLMNQNPACWEPQVRSDLLAANLNCRYLSWIAAVFDKLCAICNDYFTAKMYNKYRNFPCQKLWKMHHFCPQNSLKSISECQISLGACPQTP